MAEEDYGEASAEQKLTIAKYFIMHSPSGEVKEVVKDVKTLVSDPSILTDSVLSSIMHDYNTTMLTFAEAPNGRKVIVSSYGEVSENEYLDPSSGKVFRFNHIDQAFTEETDKKQMLDGTVDGFRKSIEVSMEKHVREFFKKDKCAFAVYGHDDGTIAVCFSAANARFSSFWTGGYRATFTLNVSSQGQTTLKAHVGINVHYFEDGNVQLNNSFDKEVNVEVKDPVSTANNVYSAVSKIQTDLLNKLEQLYVNMHSHTYKQMRRFLPINGRKMNWDTSVHSLAAEVTK